jgi:hypothetical protein
MQHNRLRLTALHVARPPPPSPLPLPGRLPVRIAVRGRVDPRATVRLEQLGQLKGSTGLPARSTVPVMHQCTGMGPTQSPVTRDLARLFPCSKRVGACSSDHFLPIQCRNEERAQLFKHDSSSRRQDRRERARRIQRRGRAR